MTDRGIGADRSAQTGRFRPGTSGNPNGRPKRRPSPLAELILKALDARINYRRGSQDMTGIIRELRIETHVDRAVKGDLNSAEVVYTILAHAARYGDPGVDQILIDNWLPDYPDQTAEQKSKDVAAAGDVEPVERSEPTND